MSGDPHSPWHSIDAWWNASATYAIELTLADGEARHAVTIRAGNSGRLHVAVDGHDVAASVVRRDGRLIIEAEGATFSAAVIRVGDQRWVFANGVRQRLTLIDPLAHAGEEEASGGHLMAPMSGTIVSVLVKTGEKVEKGKALIVLEAMKMEHTIAAPIAGIVTAVNYAVGDRVAEGADLVDLDESAS
jgi:3-methylcrotonyl-CoA carboxylase alpha subunit